MGGCFMIILLPVLIGAGLVLAMFFFALPLYAAFAAIAVLLAVVAYIVLRKNGIFERYEGDGTWRGTAATVAKWLLRLCMIFFALSGIAALAAWFVFYHG